MADALGKKIEYSGLKFPKRKPVAALQEMALDGTGEGWEKRDGELEEGEELGEDGEPDDDGGDDIPA